MNKKPSRPQVNPNTLKRLLGYLSVYKTRVILVVICILLSAIANVMSSLFIQRLIDDYISRFFLKPILYLMHCFVQSYRWHAFMSSAFWPA